MDRQEFKNNVVLVTGSSRGIGAAIARAFAREGAKVALHGRDRQALSGVESEITKAGGVARAFACELTDYPEVDHMRRDIEEAFGAVDILIANGGGNATPPAALEDIPVEGWRRTIDENLTATFLTIRSFLPGMKARRSGSIITISSATSRHPNAYAPMAYGAAKAGIILLTQDLAAQAGPFGIRANCISPATILTEKNLGQIPPDKRDMIINQHALKRLGIPKDIADAALFLASEQSSWITGIVLDVAGGYVMR